MSGASLWFEASAAGAVQAVGIAVSARISVLRSRCRYFMYRLLSEMCPCARGLASGAPAYMSCTAGRRARMQRGWRDARARPLRGERSGFQRWGASADGGRPLLGHRVLDGVLDDLERVELLFLFLLFGGLIAGRS